MLFVESRGFSRRLGKFLDEMAYRDLQNALLANPKAGVVMAGCGGLHKLRFVRASSSIGKRGGIRVIYLHIPKARRIDLLAIYGKNEKDDLTSQERSSLAALTRSARAEALIEARSEESGGTEESQ